MKPWSKDQQIQLADPVARRKAILLVVAVAIIGSVLVYVLDSYQGKLNDWLVEDPERIRERFDLITAVMAVLSLPLIIGSVYFWRIGRSIVGTKQITIRCVV